MQWIERSLQDFGYACRMVRRNPGFSTAVVLTLALGIGMNTAMFSVVNAVFLRSLPYPDASRLIWIATYDAGYESEIDRRMLPSDYAALSRQGSSFEAMAAYTNQDLALVYAGDSDTERIASISGAFWSMTAAQPTLGRLFSADEPHSIVLSWRLFNRRFAGDPRVIGKTVTLDGYAFEITGVLPPYFRFLFPQFLYPDDDRRDIDAYISIPPAALRLPMSAYRGTNWDKIVETLGPVPGFVWVIGKRKPNIPLTRARAELETIYQSIMNQQPGIYHTHTALRVNLLQSKLVGNLRPAFVVFIGAVVFVLLIVCANVANLLLARASSRLREVSIRRALGAANWRLLRQFLMENLLLAMAGGVAGGLLATGIVGAITRLGSSAVPRLNEAGIDTWALLFTLTISLIATLLFGLGPAASLLRSDTHPYLKDEMGTSSAGAGRVRVRAVLVAIEVSLAIVLLSGAGVMLKSLWRMNAFPPGFSPDQILVWRISLSGTRYESWPQQRAYLDELFRRLDSMPQVQAAGIHCATFNTAIQVQGVDPANPAFAAIEYVSPGYLRALGLPLIAGHWPSANEALDSVVVNQSFARRVAPNGHLIGRRIHASLLTATIAGIVPDFKTSQLDAEPGPAVYAAYELSPRISFITVIARVVANPAPVRPAIRKLTSGIDPNVPAQQLETLERQLVNSIAPRRFNMFLLSSFAIAALLLAVIGIYGMVAHLVAQRTREIGIRLALGAQRGEVVATVVRQGLAIVFAGALAGLLAAVALGRAMVALLYGVKPNDLSTLLAVAAALILVALLACLVPASKAARVDPAIALRHE
jgi:putative ABC transport system permease protein